MIAHTMGRRYAKALMALALERKEHLEELYQEMEDFSKVLVEDERLFHFISNPEVSPDDRIKVIDKLLEKFNGLPLLNHLVHLLIRKGRLLFFPDVVREFRYYVDRHQQVVRASVISAKKLSGEDTERIRAILKSRFGKTIVLYEEVNPDLIGGLIIKSGSLSFDGSIRSQLKEIQSQLLEEVSFS